MARIRVPGGNSLGARCVMVFACSPVLRVGSVLAAGVTVCLLFMIDFDELATPCSFPLAPGRLG